MANENDNILIKIGITGQETVKQELKKLQTEADKIQLGRSLLTPEEQKQVVSRLIKIKDEVTDLRQGISNVKGFELFARSMAPVAAGFGTITGLAKQFGLEVKGIDKAEQIMMTTMNASLVLQQLADLQNIKGAIINKANLLSETLLWKTKTGAIAGATVAQRVFNAAVKANPIGLLITVIAALAVAVGGLIAIFRRYNSVGEDTKKLVKELREAQKEYNTELDKTKDYYSKKLQEQNDILKKTSQKEKDIRKENSDYYMMLQALETAFILKQQKIRSLETLDPNYRNKLLEQSLKLHNLNVENLTRQHQKVLDNIGDIAIMTEKEKNNESSKSTKDAEKEKYELRLKYGLVSLKEQLNHELKEVEKSEEFKKLSVEDQEKIKLQIRKDYAKKWEDYQEEQNKNFPDKIKPKTIGDDVINKTPPIKLNYSYVNVIPTEEIKDSISDIEKAFDNLQINLNTSFPTTFANLTNIIKKWSEDSEITVSDWTNLISGAINEISNVILSQQTEIIQQTLQSDLDALEEETDSTMDELDKLYENNFITKEQYDKRKEEAEKKQKAEEKKLKKKAAQDEKDAQIFSSIINTAVAVTGALAQFGTLGPAAIALAVVVGVLGALETALIAG